MATSDDVLIMQAMAGPQERLTKEDTDHLMEFLWQLRSGGELSGRQRAKLHMIAEKVRSGTSSG
jgi:hypothetical protein